MNTFILVVWFLILLYFTYSYYKKRRGLLLLFILLIYTLSSFGTILYSQTFIFQLLGGFTNNLSIFPFIYWGMVFYVVCIPIRLYDEQKYTHISSNFTIVRFICILCLALSVLPIIALLPHLSSMFDTSDLASDLQNIHHDDEKRVPISGLSLLCYSTVKNLRYLTMACIVPVMLRKKKDVLSIAGILSSVILINMMSFMMSSRVTLLTTIINFIIIFLFLIPFISKEKAKKYILRFSIVLGVIVLAFIIITIGRGVAKQDANENRTIFAFVTQYLGEGFLYFNQYICLIREHTNGDYCFYIFKSLLGFDVPDVSREYISAVVEHKLGIPTLHFYTFIGFFVMDIGFIGTFVFFLFISFVVKKLVIRKTTTIHFSSFFLFFFFISTIANGTCLYTHAWNDSKAVLISLMVYLILKISEIKSNFYEQIF